MQLKMGGRNHLKLNNGERPIANKYREGKMKRTLKRELKGREIVEVEASELGQEGVGSEPRAKGIRITSEVSVTFVCIPSTSICVS